MANRLVIACYASTVEARLIRSHAPGLERGSWIVLALALGLGSFCDSLGAQARGFDATDLHGPTDLATGWLIHGGDDRAYARPDFDDSSWAPFNARIDDLRTLFPSSHPQVVWYRLHIRVAPNETGLALLESGIHSSAFEVYADGIRLMKAGEVTPYVAYDTSGVIFATIPEKRSATGSILIALRVRIPDIAWGFPQPGYRSATLALGQENSLHEHMWYSVIGGNAVSWLDFLVNLSMLMGAFLLYSTQRDRHEYFWLSLWILDGVPYMVLAPISQFHPYPANWHVLFVIQALLWPFLLARTYCAFVGHRIGWRLNLYVLLCAVAGAPSVWVFFSSSYYSFSISPVQRGLALIPLRLLQLVVLPLIMLRRIGPSNRAEGLLIIPLLTQGLQGFCFSVCLALTSIQAIHGWAWKMISFLGGTTAGPFLIGYDEATDLLSMLALALIILIRSNRVSRQQALFESEFASAREVQRIILPEAVESFPGFRIESVYMPAREVGGDFFQALPTAEGGLLLVIGDVAGKGLPAAMVVSVLVGAIRSIVEFSHAPDQLLVRLNQRMMGRTNGGFSTALAAYFDVDGSVTIANAGHLPPYLDGQEVELTPALPLGIIADAKYETMRFCLDPGSRLAFYSDGVVEAQDKHGALLGFDRGRELSVRSASAIAETAKAFGQQDDITVVVIERLVRNQTSASEQAIPTLAPA